MFELKHVNKLAELKKVSRLVLASEFRSFRPNSARMAARNREGWGEQGGIREGRTTLQAPRLRLPPFQISEKLATSAALNWYPTPFEQLKSSLGYTVYSCTADDEDGVELLPPARPCSVPIEQLQMCAEVSFPEAVAHTCINTASSFRRTGLRKNTRYTLRLSLINPGG
jgi:hypothetical protein